MSPASAAPKRTVASEFAWLPKIEQHHLCLAKGEPFTEHQIQAVDGGPVICLVSSVGYGSSTPTPLANQGSSGLNIPVQMLIRTRLQYELWARSFSQALAA
ncbi:hypothetical protein NMC42_11475 [Pseudomonas aeruginosa]